MGFRSLDASEGSFVLHLDRNIQRLAGLRMRYQDRDVFLDPRSTVIVLMNHTRGKNDQGIWTSSVFVESDLDVQRSVNHKIELIERVDMK
jgi:hypothetical protein